MRETESGIEEKRGRGRGREGEGEGERERERERGRGREGEGERERERERERGGIESKGKRKRFTVSATEHSWAVQPGVKYTCTCISCSSLMLASSSALSVSSSCSCRSFISSVSMRARLWYCSSTYMNIACTCTLKYTDAIPKDMPGHHIFITTTET